MKKTILLLGLCFFFASATEPAAFSEPSMAEYTAMPLFAAESVKPNIMIVLDNSGSMNEPAYTDSFSGAPYFESEYPIVAYDDDMEGSGAPGTSPDGQLWDLDMGEQVVGLRFQDIQVAQGATVTSAYIEFVACDSDSPTTNLTIVGEASDNADPFTDGNSITDRTATSSSVSWNDVPAWTTGTHYNSPDLSAIVQEIVNRDGWSKSSAIVFRITGSGERDAYPRNASSTLMPVLHIETEEVQGRTYYGYFNPDYFYKYSSNIFIPVYQKVSYDSGSSSWTVKAFDSATETLSSSTTTLTSANIAAGFWDGNFLNWVCMRRVDVLRKVLVGGLSNSRQGGGKQSVNGEDPSNTAHYANWSSYGFTKTMNTTDQMAVCPYHGSYTYYCDQNGALVVKNKATYDIEVQKEPVIEPEDFDDDGELAGVLQRIDTQARWGNTWFNSGGYGSNGGTVKIAIDGAAMANMISSLSDERCITSTPLAETMYVVMQYFMQEDVAKNLGYPNNCLPDPIKVGGVKDPYYNQTLDVMVPCAKSFVILLTDGGSTSDGYVPDYLKDADGDGNDSGCSGDCSSNYLDDVAFYARTNDLRSDLEGNQNLILYTIFAFADDDQTARTLLMDAARNGGFEDRNGNNKPDGDYTDDADDRLEWDENGDAIPDTYFEASDGYAMEAKLLAAITDILKRAASGTAASVLATNNQGAGNSVQAYFKPLVQEGIEEAQWLGYMQSLWVDPWGNLREDSNGNMALDLVNSSSTNTAGSQVDKIVEFFYDEENEVTKLRRYTQHYLYNPDHGSSDSCDSPEDCTVASDDLSMDEAIPIFETGRQLAAMDPDDRNIFTFIDTDEDGAVDSGEVIGFNSTNSSSLAPYLGVRDGTTWGDSGAGLGCSMDARVNNLIAWVRGTDITGLRNRTLDGVTWRLGDIISSTPMMVDLPQEYYHELYADLEYLDFIKYAKDRETMIYVGANDGMLHAFTSWKCEEDDDGNIWYEKPAGAGSDEKIGDEIWAYIPQCLLPHLKWTAQANYTHTYYVDGPVRVFDAKILDDNTYYSDGDSNPNFGTFLVFGLNMGGKEISVNEDFGSGSTEVRTFYPSYVMLDVTEPRNPKLMWERTYPELGMTTSIPAPVHIGSRDGTGSWYLVFGSGPTDYDGISSQKGHVFVVDMKTGDPMGSNGNEWIATSSQSSYLNEPLVLDLFQSHNADAIFIANNYISANQWRSDIWKIAVPCTKCQWEEDSDGNKKYDVLKDELEYKSDPAEWVVSNGSDGNDIFFKTDGPITAQLTSTTDPLDNLLLYVGTGRYMSEDDKEDNVQQYLYCIKDPFYNEAMHDEDGKYHNFDETLTLEAGDLMASDTIYSTSSLATGKKVVGYKTSPMDFWDFVDKVRNEEDGWYLSLVTNGTSPSERIITQAALLGGTLLVPTFTPNNDICGENGDTTFVGVYYETGTGYTSQVFSNEIVETMDIGGEPADIIAIRSDTSFKGMPALKAVFHGGLETGAHISTQVGTGEFVNLQVDPAFYFKSMATEWWDDPNQSPTFIDDDKCGW
jgi:type IV pilus assembly protein PilY1